MQKLMNIFILEDDILQQEYLEKLVKQLTEKNMNNIVSIFTNKNRKESPYSKLAGKERPPTFI